MCSIPWEYRLERFDGAGWVAVNMTPPGSEGVWFMSVGNVISPRTMRIDEPGSYRFVPVRVVARLPDGFQTRVPGGNGGGVVFDPLPGFDVVPRIPTQPEGGTPNWFCRSPIDGQVLIRPEISAPTSLDAAVVIENPPPSLEVVSVSFNGAPLVPSTQTSGGRLEDGEYRFERVVPSFGPPRDDTHETLLAARVVRRTGVNLLDIVFSWEVSRDYGDASACTIGDGLVDPTQCPPPAFVPVADGPGVYAGRREGRFTCTWIDAYAAGLALSADAEDGLQLSGHDHIADVVTVDIVDRDESGFEDLTEVVRRYLSSESLTPAVREILRNTPIVATVRLDRVEIARVYAARHFREPFAAPSNALAVDVVFTNLVIGADSNGFAPREIVGRFPRITATLLLVPRAAPDGRVVFVESFAHVELGSATFSYPSILGSTFRGRARDGLRNGLRRGLRNALTNLIPSPLEQAVSILGYSSLRACIDTPSIPEFLWVPGVPRGTNESCAVAPTVMGPASHLALSLRMVDLDGGDPIVAYRCESLAVPFLRVELGLPPRCPSGYEFISGWPLAICGRTAAEADRQTQQVAECQDFVESLPAAPGRARLAADARISGPLVSNNLNVLDGGLYDGRRNPLTPSPSVFQAGVTWGAANDTANAFYRSGLLHLPASASAASGARVDLDGAQMLCLLSRLGVERLCYDSCDFDGDGLLGSADPCPFNASNEGCEDEDDDGDGVPNALDNCPMHRNPPVDHDNDPSTPPVQPDSDGNGVGDACDCNGSVPPALDSDPTFAKIAASLVANHATLSIELLAPPQIVEWNEGDTPSVGIAPLRLTVHLAASGNDILWNQLNSRTAFRLERVIDLAVSGVFDVHTSLRGITPAEVASREAAGEIVTKSAEFGIAAVNFSGLRWSSQSWESVEGLAALLGFGPAAGELLRAEPGAWLTDTVLTPLVGPLLINPEFFSAPLVSVPTVAEVIGDNGGLVDVARGTVHADGTYTLCLNTFRFGFATATLLSDARIGNAELGLEAIEESFNYRPGTACRAGLTEAELRLQYGDRFFERVWPGAGEAGSP